MPANNSNDRSLFLASFLTLIAAGIGFTLRGALLGTWGAQFGFSQGELGAMNMGFAGFGVAIIVLSFFADRIGYGPLMVLAFLLHFSSAVVTLAATPAFAAYGKGGAYWCLLIGGILFSLANGTCEAVINPLTATLFPREKTHWLNILHAGWPGGLVVGALLVLAFDAIGNIRWEIQMATYLIPTLAYGFLMVGRKFPTSEAAAAGVSVLTMLLEFASPILLFLLIIHAMVGYVELGTDSWIQNITGTILKEPQYGTMLFIWTSSLMFVLRFFAGPIVHRISPLGLLFVCALLACTGLLMLGSAVGALACVVAATIYGFGKTFFWPTMLGVVSERFPRGGALTLGTIGGVGMLSAGFLGMPGIGYKQDLFATRQLESTSSAAFDRYKSKDTVSFLFFPQVPGLDNSKVKILEDNGKALAKDIDAVTKGGRSLTENKSLDELNSWWEKQGKPHEQEDKGPVLEANVYGGKQALTVTAGVPAAMAVCYLLLIIYFMARGGYKAEVLIGHAAEDEKFTGGVEGPAEP
jgi:MFS family permease